MNFICFNELVGIVSNPSRDVVLDCSRVQRYYEISTFPILFKGAKRWLKLHRETVDNQWKNSMAEDKNNIIFNISGGNNQILPNATKAEQHFYGDQFAKEALLKGTPAEVPLTDDERRLMVFIEKEESLRNYVAQLAVCRTAADVGKVVAFMCENEPHLDEMRIAKKEFIEILLPFINGVEKGRGIDNLRVQIDNAWQERKRDIKEMKKNSMT